MENMQKKMPPIPGIDEGGGSRFSQMIDGMRSVRVREAIAPVMKPQRKQSPHEGLPVIEANGLEMHWIEILAAMDAQLERGEAALKDRLSKIPNGWRDYRLASKTVARVITALYATLPEKNMRHMRMLVDHGEVVIRQKRAVRSDYVQMVANDDLKQLVNRVIASECAMCLNDAIAQKHCPLREVLERTAPTEKLKPNGLCEYLDVAAEYELGEYLK